MPDHININHPSYRERGRRDLVTIAELRARIGVLETSLSVVESDLEAIFTRISRGDEVELHMGNDEVFIITGKVRD